jgi:hypothetical protein
MSLLAHISTKYEVRLSLLRLQGVLNYGEGCFTRISEVSAFSAACPGKERLLLCLVGKQVPFFFKPARRLTRELKFERFLDELVSKEHAADWQVCQVREGL